MTNRQAPARGLLRDAPHTPNRVLLLVLIVAAALAAAYALLRPLYYRVILADRKPLTIYCDVAPFGEEPVRAVALYDRVALSPVSQALGLYQRRPPDRVRQFHLEIIERVDRRPWGVVLHDVPDGPLHSIELIVGEQRYVSVARDLRRRHGALHLPLP